MRDQFDISGVFETTEFEITQVACICSKHRLWVQVRTRGASNNYPQSMFWSKYKNQRTVGPENAHLKPDPGVLSHHEMTLTLNTHTPLLNS